MANLIDDLDHSDMHKMIAEMKLEPCLYDPNAQYYKNSKKRKEAYERITTRVNEGATKQYTVKDIMANVKNLRQKYRKYRSQRMTEFSLNEELPTAHKWWVMLHRYVKDENKITQNVLTDAAKNKKGTKQRFDNTVKLYMEAEKRYMAQLLPDEDSAAEENDDDNDGNAPAANKSKTKKSGKKCMPRYIKEVNDGVMRHLVQELNKEPSLYDPFTCYRLKEDKEKACQRLAKRMNRKFGKDGEYKVKDIRANIKIIREYYRKYRNERIQQFQRKRKLPRADKWWRKLHQLLMDEAEVEFTFTEMPLSKQQPETLIANYFNAEAKLLYDENDSD